MGRKNKGKKGRVDTQRHANRKAQEIVNQSGHEGSKGFTAVQTDVFTLADEARNTSQHDHSTWSSATLLRRKPVVFVSAGLIEPLKQPEADEQESTSDEAEVPNTASFPKSTGEGKIEESQKSSNPQMPTDDDGMEFFFDTSRSQGDRQRNTDDRAHMDQMASLTNRRASVRSDSSDEVILFRGRSNGRSLQQNGLSLDNIRIELSAVESEISQQASTKTTNEDELRDNQPQKRTRGRRGGRVARNRRLNEESDDEALIEDYISNMQGSGEMDELTEYLTRHNREKENEKHAMSDEEDDYHADDTASNSASRESSDSDSSTDEDSLNAILNMTTNVDTYGRFDPMDWERPSVRRKKGKGAKAKLELNLDELDSDLERTLQAAWKTDRQKKADRKKHRQELRARGLLGKKKNAEDTRIKYPGGMSTEQVVDELREFLMGDADSLTFPPMDKHLRKIIHELANKFKLKSKSIGKGDQRRPNLHRTLRTAPFNNNTFEQAVGRIRRRFFPRMDQKDFKSGAAGQGSYAATSYRDGDVVGAAAPELGVENRGRAMLEKMGWSRGTALGTDDNKGILQPVTQTMKRSKAGLG